MVTAGTYKKLPLFRGEDRLSRLTKLLLELAPRYEWNLQAWAVFPNHYHFIATSELPGSLRMFVQLLHSSSALGINKIDETPGKKVWFQYWDSHITFAKSYCARLNYVHQNAVHHGVARVAATYPWCSAAWFERRAEASFRKTVAGFRFDQVKVPDGFAVEKEWMS